MVRLGAVACLAAVAMFLGACSGAPAAPTTAATASPVASPDPAPTRIGEATAAPQWLGTRVLSLGPNGFAPAQETPPELRNRSIITVDELPPPPDGRFHSTIAPVPADVLARSSWTSECPVTATQLRYVTVSFRGFDQTVQAAILILGERLGGKEVERAGRRVTQE